ncbi:MAG TPA: hypothetical protein VN922_19460 [Bacteroidia bacterium]|nr:hypothetical protein [Bacteroidia bacterium]
MKKSTKITYYTAITFLLCGLNLWFSLVTINRKNDLITAYKTSYKLDNEIIDLQRAQLRRDSLYMDNYKKAFKMLDKAFEERPRQTINKYYFNQK